MSNGDSSFEERKNQVFWTLSRLLDLMVRWFITSGGSYVAMSRTKVNKIRWAHSTRSKAPNGATCTYEEKELKK